MESPRGCSLTDRESHAHLISVPVKLHVLALTILNTTDSTIIRIVADDPDKARTFLREHGFPFTESHLVVVEMSSPAELGRLMSALPGAEVNINYLSSFIPQPQGKSMLALSRRTSNWRSRS